MTTLRFSVEKPFWQWQNYIIRFKRLYLRNCLRYRPETGPIGLDLKNTIFIGGLANGKSVILAVLVQWVPKNKIFFRRFLKGGVKFKSQYLRNCFSYRPRIDPVGLSLKNTTIDHGYNTLGYSILTHITYKSFSTWRHIYYLFTSFIVDFGI